MAIYKFRGSKSIKPSITVGTYLWEEEDFPDS